MKTFDPSYFQIGKQFRWNYPAFCSPDIIWTIHLFYNDCILAYPDRNFLSGNGRIYIHAIENQSFYCCFSSDGLISIIDYFIPYIHEIRKSRLTLVLEEIVERNR